MRLFEIFFSALIFFAAPGDNAAELPLAASYQVSTEALTTERVWTLDPTLPNPHRQRWVLSRELKPEIAATPLKKPGRFGVTFKKLEAKSVSYFRSGLEWYQPLDHFPCESEPNLLFATLEGAHRAAQEAAIRWRELLRAELPKLLRLMTRVDAEAQAFAVEEAEEVFEIWRRNLDEKWQPLINRQIPRFEWSIYQKAPLAQAACHSKRRHALPKWADLMEAPSKAEMPNVPIARAPAKRWNGAFAVRANVVAADKKLNGQFLVDSTVPRSAISPAFLENQGIPPAWLEVPNVTPVKLPWSGIWNQDAETAPVIWVDSFEIGNFKLPLKEFLVLDTDLYGPPESNDSCCDGVIGNDLLRSMVIEFAPDAPAELKVWAKEGFHGPSSAVWTEIALDDAGTPSSDCELLPEKRSGYRIKGSTWSTSSPAAAQVHLPWQSTVKARGAQSRVLCGALRIGENLSEEFPKVPNVFKEDSPLARRKPGFDLGTLVLFRGRAIFDLPHGRLWFESQALSKSVPINRSGLKLAYVMKDGDRQLAVKFIAPGSFAAALKSKGLRVGDQITRINMTPAEEMNQWTVDSLLRGEIESTLSLEWYSGKKLKIAALRVK